MRKFGILLLIALAGFSLVAACGDDDDDGGTPTDGGDDGGAIGITLQEFNVVADASSADAGDVTFDIENVGPDDPHEFVVMKSDLAPGELPTVEDGSVDEEGEGVELIDEVEELEVGDTATLTVDLEAGAYVLLCNIVEEEDGELESHYQEGMYTGFTVN
jgi:uncharacterized cupredoxin-like copper-binding protein